MSTHVQQLLQAKLATLLTGDAGVGGVNTLVGGRVYDVPPDSPTYPFVTLGDVELRDWGSHTTDGFEGEVTFHVWAQGLGRKECQTILNRLYALLHDSDLAIADFPTVSFRCVFNQVLRDPDARLHHGVQRYRLLIGGNNV